MTKMIAATDMIAGLPALTVRSALIKMEDGFAQSLVEYALDMTPAEAERLIEGLQREGCIEQLRQSGNQPTWRKTEKGRELVAAPGPAPISLDDAYALVKNVLVIANELGHDPCHGFRVMSVAVVRDLLDCLRPDVPFVEMVVEIAPHVTDADQADWYWEFVAKWRIKNGVFVPPGASLRESLETAFWEALQDGQPNLCLRRKYFTGIVPRWTGEAEVVKRGPPGH